MILSSISSIPGNSTRTVANNRSAANWRRFVLKEHQATRWHYDFRFTLNGSLPSWVLPNGLCCRPGESRLAIRVEDHDCRYMISERVIPTGSYGAGPVLLSDEGFLITLPGFEDAGGWLDKGFLKFRLMSTKLTGTWTLKRRRHCANGQPNQNWDLIKEANPSAADAYAPDAFQTNPYSVLSGLTLEELRRGVKKPVKRVSMPLFEE